MDKACEEARNGNMEYITSVAEPDLARLVDKRDEDGRSLLHAAASGGSAALVNFLIEKGAAPSVKQADDEVPARAALVDLRMACHSSLK